MIRQFFNVSRMAAMIAGLALVAACTETEEVIEEPKPEIVEGYGQVIDNGYRLPPVPAEYLGEPNRRLLVYYSGDEKPGTIEVDIHAKFLYWIKDDGTAMRYPIAVGRLGRSIRGDTVIRRKEEWPGWTPTANMLRREPDVYGPFRGGIPGGLRSPLGARALYLYQGKRDTYYRIHGTNDLESIGNSGSAGCIRMFNHDIIHLFDQVPNGTRVVMRSREDSIRIEDEYVDRGIELPARRIDPDAIYSDEAVAADQPIPELLELEAAQEAEENAQEA